MLWAAELSLQSAAAILEIRNETTAIQEEGGSAVASFTGITFARHLCSRPATSTPPRPSSSWTARPPREVVSNLLRSDCSGAHHLSFNGHRRQPEDRALKGNVQAIPDEELQQTFDAVEPQLFDRIGESASWPTCRPAGPWT